VTKPAKCQPEGRRYMCLSARSERFLDSAQGGFAMANKMADSGQAESVEPRNDVYEAGPLRHDWSRAL